MYLRRRFQSYLTVFVAASDCRCCECSEKNFWITVGVFAVIWGISVQFPFVVDVESEIPELIHIDAFAKISDVESWNTWNTVYSINVTEDVDTNSFLRITPNRFAYANVSMEVRVTNNDEDVKSLCWTWEQISPFMSAFHCHNVTKVGESEYGHAKLRNHQVFYGPLSLLLHIFPLTLQQDAEEFNKEFQLAAKAGNYA